MRHFVAAARDGRTASIINAGFERRLFWDGRANIVFTGVNPYTLLTDERVRWERAPFDHPGLPLIVGHVGDEQSVESDDAPGFAGLARTRVVAIPAVGSAGRPPELGPLRPFADRVAP